MPDFLEQLDSRVLLADVAIDKCLVRDGLGDQPCAEALCVTDPDRVRAAHAAAIEAGARVIRTNSLAASPALLASLGLGDRVNEINWSAAQIARQAATGTGAFIAGRVGPLPAEVAERREAYLEQIGALLDGRCDLICLEGFGDLADLELAIDIKHELHHCPVIASVHPKADGTLGDGISLEAVFQKIGKLEADVIGIDGVPFPEIRRLIDQCRPGAPICAFPISASSENEKPPSPEEWADHVLFAKDLGCRLIGWNDSANPDFFSATLAALAEPE